MSKLKTTVVVLGISTTALLGPSIIINNTPLKGIIRNYVDEKRLENCFDDVLRKTEKAEGYFAIKSFCGEVEIKVTKGTPPIREDTGKCPIC